MANVHGNSRRLRTISLPRQTWVCIRRALNADKRLRTRHTRKLIEAIGAQLCDDEFSHNGDVAEWVIELSPDVWLCYRNGRICQTLHLTQAQAFDSKTAAVVAMQQARDRSSFPAAQVYKL